MASFTAGTTFTDGVANDVTAAKLGALITAATPTSGFIQDRTAETVIASNDTVLIGDASDSNNLKRITVANFAQTLPTANITTGTIETGTFGTTTSTAATITTGTIPTLVATTLITSGTGTAAAPAIVPTGDTNTGIFFPAADTIAFSDGGTEAMRINSSGNVGIGETAPGSILHVTNKNLYTGKLTFGGMAATGTVVNNEAVGNVYSEYLLGTWNLTRAKIRAEAGTGGGDGVGGGVISLWTGTSAGVQSERLRIDSSGNVGIGTTSPATPLNISTSASSVVSETIRIENSSNTSSNGNKITWRNAGQTTEAAFISGFREGAATSFGVAIGTSPNFTSGGTNAVERLRIDSSGNVGIGTTSPQSRLHSTSTSDGAQLILNGPQTINEQTLLFRTGYHTNNSSAGFSAIGSIDTGGQGGILTLKTTAAGSGSSGIPSERVRIDSSGFVSIGTATALSRLHVHGDLTLSNTTTSTTGATGGVSKPATYAGFLTVSINGTSRKIPYYA